ANDYFRTDTTGARGMSIVIAQNGKVKYQKGFGIANARIGKEANGHTIYRLASVSKAITGVLAFKLDMRNRFDVNKRVREYEDRIPRHHIHTITELLSCRGRVRHYVAADNGFRRGTSLALPSAFHGSQLFMDDPLVQLPSDSFYVYSTHAYTLVAAAMEKALGRSFSDLVEREISNPYKLPTLKCEDHQNISPDHALLYIRRNGRFEEINRLSYSWAYAGAGMESSAYDLAQFGVKLMDRWILNQNTIDAMLMVPDTDADYANGWLVGTTGDEDYYAKGGSQDGTRSYIVCVPSKKLVVTVLCNTRVDNIHQFGRALARASW
ncbi:MAG: serine hydrolase domain-containing protein, partial [Bacteroidota bacterium]